MSTSPSPSASDMPKATGAPVTLMDKVRQMRLVSMFGEIVPLCVFFFAYENGGLFFAALATLGATLVSLLVYWLVEKRVARFIVFSTLLSGAMTLTAVLVQEELLIKVQPSVFSFVLAAVLLGGLFQGRAMMQVFFGTQFNLTQETWFLLSRRWGFFFLFAALSNELAWRVLSEAHWVYFRVFVMPVLTGGFMMAMLPLTLRGTIAPDINTDSDTVSESGIKTP